MTLGDIIKQYRYDTHSTMETVANLCGITKGYVAMLEKNINPKTNRPIKPTLETILKVCKGLKLDVDEVFSKFNDDYVVKINPTLQLDDSDILSENEFRIIEAYRASDAVTQEMVRRCLGLFTPEETERDVDRIVKEHMENSTPENLAK